jgi:predicted N-formylglutamate amidohydrolase
MPSDYCFSMTDAPFEFIPASGTGSGLIFLCDHASNRLPPEYGTLGLDPGLLTTHIASDIGAADVTRALAERFESPAILARWSRLLADLNRGEDDPTLVMKLSDGSVIPGNRDADAAEIARRIASYHAPYHARIAQEITAISARGIVPVLVSMHSFTPRWKGFARPWEVGVLWDRDARLARPMIAALSRAGFRVGDNEPYSGELENDCLNRHGTRNKLPHVLIEIRQDLIADSARAEAFAGRLAPILAAALADMCEAALRFTRELAM